MKQEKSRTGEDAGGGEEPHALGLITGLGLGRKAFVKVGYLYQGPWTTQRPPAPTALWDWWGAIGPTGNSQPVLEGGGGKQGQPLPQFTFRINKVCARVSGEREAYGRATSAWGHLLLGSGTPYLPFHLPGAFGWSLYLALGVSCSDLLLSPSSASSTKFPSSESLRWLVSAHLGVWDISEAWLEDSERTQEGLPLKLSGLGAPGVLRCREVLVSHHLTLVEWPWGSENCFLSR